MISGADSFTLDTAANAAGLEPDTLAAQGRPAAPMRQRIADPARTWKPKRGRPPEAGTLRVLRALLRTASDLSHSADREIATAARWILEGLKKTTRQHLATLNPEGQR